MTDGFRYSDAFRCSFENNCIELLVTAYYRVASKKSIVLDWNENDITAELHDYIDNDPVRINKNISSNVEHHLPDKATPKVKGFSARFARIDMRFTIISSAQESKFFMEAKNLKQTSSRLKKRYITTGIDNFVCKKYTNGCLVGYLLAGNLEQTIRGINAILIQANRSNEVLIEKKSSLFKWHFESSHAGIENIRHFIFDFTRI